MADETTTPSVEIWAGALETVLDCVPAKDRLQVLQKLMDAEVARRKQPFRIFDLDELRDEYSSRHWSAEQEAVSLIVQVLVRSITSDHSEADAAKILFREHRMGTGSGWLPDYLSRLPGLKVDRKRCAAISDTNGASELSWTADGRSV